VGAPARGSSSSKRDGLEDGTLDGLSVIFAELLGEGLGVGLGWDEGWLLCSEEAGLLGALLGERLGKRDLMVTSTEVGTFGVGESDGVGEGKLMSLTSITKRFQ
jgi:hypothetical protein